MDKSLDEIIKAKKGSRARGGRSGKRGGGGRRGSRGGGSGGGGGGGSWRSSGGVVSTAGNFKRVGQTSIFVFITLY